MVITTPMIVYRHGDDVPGERIKKILVYKDCISQPNRNVENPDNSDLLQIQSACAAQIELKGTTPSTRLVRAGWDKKRPNTEVLGHY